MISAWWLLLVIPGSLVGAGAIYIAIMYLASRHP